MTAHVAQRRIVITLSLAQALGGVASGLVLGVGALLMKQVTGSESFAGLAATLTMVGSSIAAVPLARLAERRGRRIALASGSFVAFIGTTIITLGGVTGLAPIVMLGFLAVGVGTTVNLQSRFAATDLAEDRHRARDLSIVVWATTLGVILGPNLISFGDTLGMSLGMPHFVGSYLLAAATQLTTGFVILALLRPDPLLTARSLGQQQQEAGRAPTERVRLRAYPGVIAAIVLVAAAHATMVGIMSITPVHLEHVPFSLEQIGFTMSAHMAGMYALSPLFGWMADRLGKLPTVLVGELVFVAAIAVTLIFGGGGAMVALFLLGVGWSAVLVAGSAWMTELTPRAARPAVQGRSDLIMGAFGALAGASSGPLMWLLGYNGLNLVFLAVVGAASAVGVVAWRRAGRE